MGAHEKRPTFDALLPPRRFGGFESGVLERSRNVASDMTGRLPECGRERSVRHNRSNPWNNDGNGGNQVGGEFAEPRGGA